MNPIIDTCAVKHPMTNEEYIAVYSMSRKNGLDMSLFEIEEIVGMCPEDQDKYYKNFAEQIDSYLDYMEDAGFDHSVNKMADGY